MKKILLLPLLALLCLSLSAIAGTFPDITLPQLKSAIASKQVTLLDVNGPVSYANGHIPGAIDFTAHTANLASVLPSDKNALIVAYCGNEHCGAYARLHQCAAFQTRHRWVERGKRDNGKVRTQQRDRKSKVRNQPEAEGQ